MLTVCWALFQGLYTDQLCLLVPRPYQVHAILPTVQIRSLGHRQVKQHTEEHRTGKQWSQGLSAGSPDPQLIVLTAALHYPQVSV